MPVHTNLRFNVRFPEIPDGGPQPKMVIGPAPDMLVAEGPGLEVHVTVTDAHAKYLEDNGMEIPQPISGKALVDTGASISAVDVSVLERLGTQPIGCVRIHTPQGTDLQEIYPAKMLFPGSKLGGVQSLTVVGNPAIAGQGLLALIGRDILKNWLLVYNGASGNVTIAA